MVQPNIRIYPVRYISPRVYETFQKNINNLAKERKLDFAFNHEEQCFDIKGRSQQACDDFALVIEENLLPQLNKGIDDLKFRGTFEDLGEVEIRSTQTTPSTTRTSTPDFRLTTGRQPFQFEESNRTPTETPVNLNHDYYETDSDDSVESEEEFVETFTFAKNVPDPKEVLTGPLINNAKAPDYLRIIGNDTDTECSLENRKITIIGKSEEDVKEALERFRNLQTFYKRRRRPTVFVPCVHYPSDSAEFGLFFCSLDRYAQRNFVDLLQVPASPLYVIIPSFKNKAGDYQKPKELMDVPQSGNMQQSHMQRQQQQQQQQQSQEMSLDERMRMASLEFGSKKSYGNMSAGLAPDQRPLWGENKTFVTHTSQSSRPASSSSKAPPVIKKEPVEDFPALGSSSVKPKVLPKTSSPRRVMRITSQKSAAVAKTPQQSFQNVVKDYNFHNMKTALEEGLSGVRGFKGEIKITAKLGKILWSNLTPDIAKRIWEFQNLKDILMKEKDIKPNFNDVTTSSDEVITKISEILPQPYSKSAYFEIHARATNQPTLPKQNVIMHVNQGVVGYKKIVTSINKITVIDWVSLERKFDFRLQLQTEETTRADVKPYSTFLKKIMINPVTRQITYENVPDFLEVDYILLRQTTRYRIHFPFVVEITRIEKVPLIQQKFDSKIAGETGKGQVWYDLEIYYSTFDELFKGNSDLPAGKLASWTVEEVLGDEDQALVDYIRCLLIMVEKCEKQL